MTGPRLSVCMIVKDEEQYLGACLKSVRGVADEIIVVDTGSTDRSPEIAAELGARVVSFPWTGSFAESRNVSLDHATGDWILVLDGDDELASEDRSKVRPLLNSSDVEGFFFTTISFSGVVPGADFEIAPNLRLFRNKREYRFSGTIHEQIVDSILSVNPEARFGNSGVRVYHYGYLSGSLATKDKIERNLSILNQQVKQNSEDRYLRQCLGMEYFRLGRYEEALTEFARAKEGLDPRIMWGSRVFRSMAVCLIELRRYDQALGLIAEGMGAYPDYTDLVFLEGAARFRAGQHAMAVGALHQCLSMGAPPVPPYITDRGMYGYKAYYFLGRAYESLGRRAEALQAYHKSFENNTAFLEPLGRRARILLEEMPEEGVRSDLERFFALDSPPHLVVLADIFGSLGRYRASLDYLTQASLIEAPSPQSRFLKGHSLAGLGRYRDALTEFQEVPADGPLAFKSAVESYYCLWMTGQAEAAAELLATDDGELRRAISEFLREKDREVLEKGLRRFPEASILRAELSVLPGASATG